MSGWVRLERKLFDDEHGFFPREPMSEREAWIWMWAKGATWADTTHWVGGENLPVPRGSFMTTLRELQSIFMWRSDTKVRNFLKRLEQERMIERTVCGPRNAPKTHVTICKYEEYQASERTTNARETHEKRTDERSKVTKTNNKQSSSIEDFAEEAFAAFQATADRIGSPVPKKMQADRKRALISRLKDCGGIADFKALLARAEASDFLTGRTHHGFKMTFDFFVGPKNFRKLMEGNYDNRTRSAPPQQSNHSRASSPHDSLLAGFRQLAQSGPADGDADFGGGETAQDASHSGMDCWPGGDPSQPVLRVVGTG